MREPFLNGTPDRTPPHFSGGMVAGCGITRPRGGGLGRNPRGLRLSFLKELAAMNSQY
ncbi:MAG: hypothetical protein HYT37_04585 [Candidatus Sungbacteria bacterium]|nr:hypothetical protein [Candidatus Sungbacteria bacterium]